MTSSKEWSNCDFSQSYILLIVKILWS